MSCSHCVALQGFIRILSFDKPVRRLMLGCQHVEWLVPVCHHQLYPGILNTVHTQTLKEMKIASLSHVAVNTVNDIIMHTCNASQVLQRNGGVSSSLSN